MGKASDILRERAQKADDIIAAYGLMHPDELRAIVDLLEACTEIDEEYGVWCRLCNAINTHDANCVLAAAERAIYEPEEETGASE